MFIKIPKSVARVMYGRKTFIIVPCKLRPRGLNAVKVTPSLTHSPELIFHSFDSFVHTFEFEDCRYEEIGRKAAFYIEI